MLGVDGHEAYRAMSESMYPGGLGLHHSNHLTSHLDTQHPGPFHGHPGSLGANPHPSVYPHQDYHHQYKLAVNPMQMPPVHGGGNLQHQEGPLAPPDNRLQQTEPSYTQDELPPPPPITPPPAKERFSYTRYQLHLLNGIYTAVRYPNSIQKQLIAKRVGITRDQVKIWFQNRRRKDVIGPKAGQKSKSPPSGEENGVCMVPETIMKGVLTELERYGEDMKQNNKKNKGKITTQPSRERPKPYDVSRKRDRSVSEGRNDSPVQQQLFSLSAHVDNSKRNQFEDTESIASLEPCETMSPPAYNASPVSSVSSSSNISIVSSPPSNNNTVPTSAQLDMVAPPNAIAPGAQFNVFPPDGVPPMSESPCIAQSPPAESSLEARRRHQVSPPFSSGEQQQPTSHSRQSSPASDRQLTHQPPDNTNHHRQESNSGHNVSGSSGSQGSIREYSGHPGIFAPIPSYAHGAAPHPNWPPPPPHPTLDKHAVNAHAHAHAHAMQAGVHAPNSHMATGDFPLYGKDNTNDAHHSAGFGQMNSGLGQHPLYPSSYSHHHGAIHTDLSEPSHPHCAPTDGQSFGLNRVFPFPIVADSPRLLSTMPAAYSDPYSSAYKSSAVPSSMHPALYRDAYQPLLISTFNNPYYGMDSASWQTTAADRKTFTSL